MAFGGGKMAAWSAALLLGVCLLLEQAAWAQQVWDQSIVLSHQNPPKVAAGQMASAEGKLDAAMAYADWFLTEDGTLRRAFSPRDPHFPTWKDQPINDCGTTAVIRAFQIDEPYFEDRKQKVVVVPVMVELLALDVHGQATGPLSKEVERSMRQDDVGCTFEYERYNFATQRFEKRPNFRKHSLAKEFYNWGEVIERYPYKGFSRYVVPDLDKRYVRFRMRVSVSRNAPYQLEPQFPRHYFVNGAVAKWRSSNDFQRDCLAKGISDNDPNASGEELAEALHRMPRQVEDRSRLLNLLQEHLSALQSIPSFSEVKP